MTAKRGNPDILYTKGKGNKPHPPPPLEITVKNITSPLTESKLLTYKNAVDKAHGGMFYDVSHNLFYGGGTMEV